MQRNADILGQDRRRRGQRKQAKTRWTKAWLKRRSMLGWYDTLLKELASEEQKNYFNLMRMDGEFFNEILARVSTRITRKPNNFGPSLPPGLLLLMTLR